MTLLLTGMLPPYSTIFHCHDYAKLLHSGGRFLVIQTPTHLNPSLRIEARGIPRKESAKVRNRRIRKKFNGSQSKPRLSVFCSSRQLYAMLVDDFSKKTLFYASTLQESMRYDPPCSTIEAAQRVGEALVRACEELQISEISSYDRNGFAPGEKMRAFEVPIAQYGFLTLS